jgi:hypothetical protein
MKKYSHVLATGCSFTVGANILDKNEDAVTTQKKYRVSSLVAKHLNIPEVNVARPGGSNESIIRKAFEWIEENPSSNPLVLIGLSGLTRMEIWSEHDQLFYDIHPFDFPAAKPWESVVAKKRAKKLLGDESLNKELYTWAKTYTQNFYNTEVEEKRLRRKIKLFDSYLKLKNIDYFIWNSIEDNLGELKNELPFISFGINSAEYGNESNLKYNVNDKQGEFKTPEDCWYHYIRKLHAEKYPDFNDTSKRSNYPPYGEYFCGGHPSPGSNKILFELIKNRL